MSATTSATALENPLTHAYAQWRAIIEAELKGASFEKKFVTRTFDGPALQPLYTRENLAEVRDLGTKPGAAPYLRGVRPLGYKLGGWEIAQKFTASTAADFNAALLTDLASGQNSVALQPDRATCAGCDPDEAAAGDVGREGVSLVDADDVHTALKDINLGAMPVHMVAGSDPLPLAALYIEVARRRDMNYRALTGSLTADPLGAWVTQGEIPATLDLLYDSLATWTGWVNAYAPRLQTVGVDAGGWGDAGGTATQELAFALATAVEYLRALDARDVKAAAVAPRFAFSFAIGPQFFTEIAKFRALRPLWTRVLTAFGLRPEAAAGASVSAVTGRWNKTLLDPHVNMLRVTTEALSGVLGGCDRLHIAPFDEVSGATNEFSRRIARNVHTLLGEEFSFAETADPAGGSWYVEKLTDELARTAWALFQDIERRGGMAAALRAGYPQELVEKVAAEKRDAVARRRVSLIGTNLFPNLRETSLTVAKIDSQAGTMRPVGEKRFSHARDLAETVRTFDPATRFSAAISAAREGATIGQLRAMVRGTNSVTDSIVSLVPRRAAEDFEALRIASEEFARRTGARPRVFLAKMGALQQHKARADFSAGFFAVGGFDIIAKQIFETAEDAAAAAIASKAQVAVLCSTDETYPLLVPAFASAVHAVSPRTVLVLAGLPTNAATVATYREAGIDEFIHLRANAHAVLAGLLERVRVLQ